MLINNLLSAIYPAICLSCEQKLILIEDSFCMECEQNFNALNYSWGSKNNVDQLFWGKSKIIHANALYEFVKNEPLQQLIHQFKYKGNKKLALRFGREIGTWLLKQTTEQPFQAVSFVPMHKKKQRKRGYNQGEILAKGVASILNIPVVNAIIRTTQSSSQTDKGVYERHFNMINKFTGVRLNPSIENLLIVDDVITTGATLSVCANEIQKVNNVEISVLALAYRNL